MSITRFVIIGHVDHGKSTLAGHLLYKVGAFSKHEIEKTFHDAESSKTGRWKYAYLLDTESEERARGKTHEHSIVPFEYEGVKYELIDTPGHASFVRKTIQGIGAFPNVTAVLVISAIENEFNSGFQKGMTKEQCILARASGVEHIIIAINKMDAVNWKDDAITEIQSTMKSFIKSLKFKSVEYIPISAYDGIGIIDILTKLQSIESTSIFNKLQHSPKGKEKENILVNVLDAKLKVLKCENIITIGYDCIVHFKGEEYDATISNIKDKKFIKTGDIAQIKLTFSSPVPNNIERIILRKNDSTIGFATTC